MDIPGNQGVGSLPSNLAPTAVTAAWLPGTTEVHVVGQRFYAAAIHAVQLGAQPGDDLKGMLVPEPDNPDDHDAVAIYLEGRKVGHLAASIAPQVQSALFAFSRSHNGHFVACPGRIYQLGFGPEVVLSLDTEPLGLAPEIFDHIPDLDRVLLQTIDKLDLPAPQMTGRDPAARQALAAAEALWTEIDEDFDRSPRAWPHAESDFREVARRLENVGDPLVSDAWAGVARSVRYQRGRQPDRNGRIWIRLCFLAGPRVPAGRIAEA
jgi:hypothetical protein